MDIVFFGDSVIGNYVDSTSVPGVAAGLSGAKTYNMGVGGATATFLSEDEPSIVTMVDAFISADSSTFTEEQQIKYGIEEYYADHEEDSGRETCFIINYGFNDYFCGLPVEERQNESAAEIVSESNPYSGTDNDGMDSSNYDAACYKGALKAAVAKLRNAFPECRIVLMTPGYCSYYNSGTIPMSSEGGILTDYVKAVIGVADEMNVEYMDNYHGLGINQLNYDRYLVDGCHPNTMGRYIMAWHIVKYLAAI
jgi:lysophospholipase L1-like esterase